MRTYLPILLVLWGAGASWGEPTPVWKFAVSGDSRDCGDLVMPAIASGVLKSGAKFYWHLGDFRWIYDFDEDMVPPASLHLNTPHLPILLYLKNAWTDFIDHQLRPFAPLEIFLSIGNHEVVFPQTRKDYLNQFATYLDTPRLREQRRRDHDRGGARTYFHWVMNGSIDFLSLDNASGSAFDADQMDWIRARLKADAAAPQITTIVVGMHAAMPGSKGMGHSMCDSPAGIQSGTEIYDRLWKLHEAGKNIYLLASHTHFVMDDVYRTSYWKGRVLPGWIIGTAGAVRYRLVPGIIGGTVGRTDVYGYLVATVMSDGSIEFEFREVGLEDMRLANGGKAADALVQWCYAENKDLTVPPVHGCGSGAQ